MDQREQQELISAYLDGELTPEERAAAEGMLEASPELRRDLDDFARLSELMRALPKETAPPELAATVRRQAEQQSLLAPNPALPRRSLKREWLSALAGMAVTAAAMLVMIQYSERHSVPSLAQTEAGPAAATSDFRTSEMLGFRNPQNASDMDLRSADSKSVESSREAGSSLSVAQQPAPAALQQEVAATGADAPAQDFAMEVSGGSLGSGVLSGVRIGDMLQYLEKQGDQVAVVELQVVDVQQSTGQLEVLLHKHQVHVVPDEEWALKQNLADKDKNGRRPTDPATPPGTASGELITYFLDTSKNQVDELFEDMSRQNVFVQAKLQPPVEVPATEIAEHEKPASETLDEGLKDRDAVNRESDRFVKEVANKAVQEYFQRRSYSQGNAAQGIPNSPQISRGDSPLRKGKLPPQQAVSRNAVVPMRTNLDAAAQAPESSRHRNSSAAAQKTAEKSAPAAETDEKKLSPADETSAPEPTVRVLFVLQQAVPTAMPKE